MTKFMHRTRRSASARLIPAAAAAALLAVATAPAHGASGNAAAAGHAPPQAQGSLSPAQRKQLESFRETRGELMKARRKLESIREKTVKKHPELQKQQKAFRDLMIAQMKSKGHTPKKDVAEVRKLQQKLRSGKASDSDRRALMTKLQKKSQAFLQAQQEALQAPKVKKARKKLHDSLLAAMKQEDPSTEQLLQTMREKRQKLMEIRSSATRQQSGK